MPSFPALDPDRTRQGTLIPVGEDIESFGLDDDVSWVLIVEKEVRPLLPNY
jgi:hypothetical protein